MRINEGVDNPASVEERETFRNLRHDLENVAEVWVRATLVHDMVQESPVNALLQNNHVVQYS